MKRETLSLKKKPEDPHKIAQSLSLGLRFIDRKGRYILQAHVSINQEHDDFTWVDVPLCSETYKL